MYDKKLNKLDSIIKTTLNSIDVSKKEIEEISNVAKKEYVELEEEFIELRKQATELIEDVKNMESDLKESKLELAYVSKNHIEFTEEHMKIIYEKTDNLRLNLAVQKEKEQSVIIRRNDLEIHLKGVRLITDRADKLSNYFNIAFSAINGELSEIDNEVEDIKYIKNWGIKAIQIQEMERKRIARDMHDGPTQSLTNLIFKTEVCIKLLDKDIEQTKVELQTLKNLIRNTIDETRRLIYNLRPMSIDDLGFIATLSRYVEKFKSDTEIEVDFTYNQECINKINADLTLTLYRVSQETLNNIFKHANATLVIIELTCSNDLINFRVIDNGIGFDVNKKKNEDDNSGYGLVMLKERIIFHGGDLKISSVINKGTIIDINIPIDEGDSE